MHLHSGTRSHETWAMIKELKDLKKQPKITWLLQQMHVYVLFPFIDTISRLRVGFSVGGTLTFISELPSKT